MKTPVVAPPSARQFVAGAGEVPQQVPRAEILAGTPREVTVAPKVAPVVVIDATVGAVTVGMALGGLSATAKACLTAPIDVPAIASMFPVAPEPVQTTFATSRLKREVVFNTSTFSVIIAGTVGGVNVVPAERYNAPKKIIGEFAVATFIDAALTVVLVVGYAVFERTSMGEAVLNPPRYATTVRADLPDVGHPHT